MGLISRLAFGEVINKPETIKYALQHIKPKLWKFLGVGIAIILKFCGFYFLWLVGSFFILIVLNATNSMFSEAVSNLINLTAWMMFFLSLFALPFWLISRYLMIDMPLAIESDHNVSSANKRIFDLRKGNNLHIYGIIMVSGLISVPLLSVAVLLQIIPSYLGTFEIERLAPLITVSSLLVNAAISAVITPFWQSIKAVIYYNLREHPTYAMSKNT